jgi:predicted dehydrogenase
MANQSISAPVRFGVVGTGGMGSAHCSFLQHIEEARLTAICDIDPATAARVGAEYGVPFFTDHHDLLASGLCDAITIATPHPAHPFIAMDAMKAGLHVMCEKPLSERVSTADALIATARETGMAFTVMFMRRLEPAFAKAIEIVRSGQLGKVYRTTLISPEYRCQAYYNSGGWRATWSGEGGGVMMNQSPHVLDLFIQLGGKPNSVFARVETRLHDIEVEDLAEAMVTYPDGGSGYFYCSTNEAGPGQMIEVFGDKGKLICRDGSLKMYTFTPGIEEFTRTNTTMWDAPTCTEVPLTFDDHEHGHAAVLRNLARHLLYGEPLSVPGETGIDSLELANAAWLSAHLNAPVTLPIDRAVYDAFLEKKRQESTFVKTVTAQRVTDPNIAK